MGRTSNYALRKQMHRATTRPSYYSVRDALFDRMRGREVPVRSTNPRYDAKACGTGFHVINIILVAMTAGWWIPAYILLTVLWKLGNREW